MCILGGHIFEFQILDPILIFTRASYEVEMGERPLMMSFKVVELTFILS